MASGTFGATGGVSGIVMSVSASSSAINIAMNGASDQNLSADATVTDKVIRIS